MVGIVLQISVQLDGDRVKLPGFCVLLVRDVKDELLSLSLLILSHSVEISVQHLK